MITAAQMRAARALLGIDQRQLADLSGLSLPTIQRMEGSEDTIRGNVDSRLRRLQAGEYDGLLLAAVGLDRLGIPIDDADRLPLDLMLPAPGQGALVLQVRAPDRALRTSLRSVDHRPTRIAVDAERELLRAARQRP